MSLDVEQHDDPYSSASELRVAHSDLLRRERAARNAADFRAEVVTFIRRGRETGKFLDDDDERRACQGMLDYWTTVLYRSPDDEPIDSTLELFDPALAPLLPDDPSPYVGLKAFDEQHHQSFFGRRDHVRDLVQVLRKERFAAVVGPSGSGKSSLVLSGLMPALRAGAVVHSQNWHFFPPMVPGSAPLASLAQALRPARATPADWETRLIQGMLADALFLTKVVGALTRQPALIIVDQFEELFTLGARQPEMDAFAANLLALVRSSGLRHTVVITMRSDFEAKMALLPDLKPLFDHAQVRVTPMGAPELREAIEEPARQVGLKIEPRVVNALINDILGYDAALPLLQFTLLRLWELRDHNRVTWDIYQQTGGGKEALERSAEAFYKELPAELQQTMRRILLRMVRPRAGLEFTSKRIRRAELYPGGEADYRIDEVVAKMLKARLLRQTDAGTADEQLEVAHEALVRNWRRLVDWLEAEREQLREQQRLAAAAESWKTLGEDPNALLRGVVLDEALRLPTEELGQREREFLRASLRARVAAEQAAEEARRRELAQVRALAAAEQQRAIQAQALAETEHARAQEQLRRTEAETARASEAERRQAEERARAETERLRATDKERSARRLRSAALILAVVLGVAVIAGIYAYMNYLEAARQRVVAEAAQATSDVDATKASIARSDAISAQQTAIGNANRAAIAEGKAKTSAAIEQLARKTAEAAATIAVAAQAKAQSQANTNAAEVIVRQTAEAQARDAEAQALAAKNVAEQQAQALSTAQAEAEAARQTAQALQAAAEDNRDRANAFALRDKALLESDRARRLQLMVSALQFSSDISILQDYHTALQLNHLPVRINSSDVVLAWSPDGSQIAVASGSELELWNAPQAAAGFRNQQMFVKQDSIVTSIAWSPDGKSIVLGRENGNVELWDAASQQRRGTFSGHTGSITGLAWRPDSSQVVTSSDDGTFRIWNIASRTANVIIAKSNERVAWASWRADGSQIVSSAGNTIYIRDANTGVMVKELNGHQRFIHTVAWSPDGRQLLSASEDGTARIWEVASGVTTQRIQVGSAVNSAFWSPDGQRIATASDDATVRIWAAGNASALIWVLPTGDNVPLSTALWNPDGWRLAVSALNGTVREFWPPNSTITTDQLLGLGQQLLSEKGVPTLAPAAVDKVLEKAPTAVPAATITLTPSATPTRTATPTATSELP